MDEPKRAKTTALPIDNRPEVHEAGAGTGRSAPISLEQDKRLRDGRIPRLGDERMRNLPDESGVSSGVKAGGDGS
jgi:hypothetical protein